MSGATLATGATRVIVTDGGRALQLRVYDTFNGVTLVLDLLHVLEKLWKAARALYPEGAASQTSSTCAPNGSSTAGRPGRQRPPADRDQTPAPRRKDQDTARRHGYYHRNRDRMRYDHYLAYQLADHLGTVEGACRT